MGSYNEQDRDTAVYRFVLALAFLGLAAGAAVVLLAAFGAVDPVHLGGRDSGNPFGMMSSAQWQDRIAIGLVAAVTGVMAMGILVRMVARPKSAATLHILDVDDRGFVVVDSRGISRIAAQAALSAHGVVAADVSPSGTGSSPLRLKVEAGVYPGANLKRAGVEIRQTVREAVETLVGIGVREVAVRARVVEADSLAGLLR